MERRRYNQNKMHGGINWSPISEPTNNNQPKIEENNGGGIR
jgi:hypothetical protein